MVEISYESIYQMEVIAAERPPTSHTHGAKRKLLPPMSEM